jgi:DNA polymerase I-like protein with 3'-5' exonuclease and polymerase domains/intein/homing endonuclease
MSFFDFLEENSKIQVRKRDWLSNFKFHLVTPDNITAAIDTCLASPTKRIAVDLETTGLDNRVFNGKTVDRIVGICLSPDGVNGYYLPISHGIDEKLGKVDEEIASANIPQSLWTKEFGRLMAAFMEGSHVALFHYGKFDQEFLEFTGIPGLDWNFDSHKSWEDSLILVYLTDAHQKEKKLKKLTFKELGFDQIELDELFPEGTKDLNFALLDPRDEAVLWYGGGDGIFTYLLCEKFLPKVQADQAAIYAIEKSCVTSTRWMERCRILRDLNKTQELIRLGHVEWLAAIQEVYAGATELLGRDCTPSFYRKLFELFDPQDATKRISSWIDLAKAKSVRDVDPSILITKATPKGEVTYPYVYDISSPQQLGHLFEELEVPGLRYTEKSEQVKTSKDELDRVVTEASEQFPFMGKVKKFREVQKALSTYLYPMAEDADPIDGSMKISFNGHKVDTGRFATPAGEGSGKQGIPALNLQAIPASYDTSRPECMTRLRETIVAEEDEFVVACVDENARIPTSRGDLRIRDVAIGDLVLTENGWKPVSAVTYNGTKPVVRVRTRSGYELRVTSDHLMRVERDTGRTWVEAGKLRPGDRCVLAAVDAYTAQPYVALPPLAESLGQSRTAARVPAHFDELVAEFLGRVFGSGFVESKGKLPVSVGFKFGSLGGVDYMRTTNDWSQFLFGVSFKEKYLGDGEFRFWGNQFARWVQDFTKKWGDVPNSIPEEVWLSSVGVQASFLRGVFELDAKVTDHIDLLIGGPVAQELQVLLLKQGVRSVRSNDHLRIEDSADIIRFTDRIGFSEARNQEKLLMLTGNRLPKDKSWGRTFTDELESVCSDGEAAVWDLTVPDGNNFQANGLVVHNCFAAETEIITADGIKQIGGLAGTTQRLLTNKNGVGTWVDAPIWCFGVQPLQKIIFTQRGSEKVVSATAEHRWSVWDYSGKTYVEVTTRELRPGARMRSIYVGPEEGGGQCHGCGGLGVGIDRCDGEGNVWQDECPDCGGTGSERAYWVVKSVEPTDRVEKVFCATVDGSHNFALAGHLFSFNCDYSGVELRIVTNLSREPKWLAEYFRCSACEFKFECDFTQGTPKTPPPRCPKCGSDKIGDLHTLTALSVYGENSAQKPDWKFLRQKAKQLNFAMVYGGGGSAAQRAVGGDKNEGYRIKTTFDKQYPGLARWWEAQKSFAHKNGFVFTAFGRKLSLPDINSPDGFFRSKSERNSINGPVQGLSADITKIAMALIYRMVKKKGWLDKVKMFITMHDELVFRIHGSILEEAIETIRLIMINNDFIKGRKWPVPLTSDVEIGKDWSVPWNLDSMRSGEVRYVGNKKIKNPDAAAKAGLNWEQLPRFPEALAPLFKLQTLEAFAQSPYGEHIQWTEEMLKAPLGVMAPVIEGATAQPSQPQSSPPQADSSILEYKLRISLSPSNAQHLSDLLHRWHKNVAGTCELRLLDSTGAVLEGWNPGWKFHPSILQALKAEGA